jgi:AraC-like DNA-binding protein
MLAQPKARLFGGGVNRLRDPKLLASAKQRIASGWKLQNVAAELGYATRAAFTRAFAQATGLSVPEWRLTTEGLALREQHVAAIRAENAALAERVHPSGRCWEARMYW